MVGAVETAVVLVEVALLVVNVVQEHPVHVLHVVEIVVDDLEGGAVLESDQTAVEGHQGEA